MCDLHRLASACICRGTLVMLRFAADYCKSAFICCLNSCNACKYMFLRQMWQNFYCMLTPRKKVPGCVSYMQLLVLSKAGPEPVTSIVMTNAGAIEVPAKVAHRFELVLCQSWHHLCCQLLVKTAGNEVCIMLSWSSYLLESVMGCLNKDHPTCTGMGVAAS